MKRFLIWAILLLMVVALGCAPKNATEPTVQTQQSSGSISGKVHDEKGQPMANAQITVGGARVGTTKSDGSFTVANLKAGTYVLQFSRPGYAPSLQTVKVAYAQAVSISIILKELMITGSLLGKVSDASGKGLPEVQIVVDDTWYGATQSDGSYLLPKVAAGTRSIAFNKKVYTSKQVTVYISKDTTSTQDVTLAAAPLSSVSGKVKDDEGNALPDVTISANGSTYTSVAEGYYEIRGLPEGKTKLVFRKNGYIQAEKEVTILATGSVSQDVSLGTTPAVKAGIRGYVKDSSGNPIADVNLVYSYSGNNSYGYEMKLGKTGSNGYYKFDNIPTASLTVRYSKPGYVVKEESMTAKVGEWTRRDVILDSPAKYPLQNICFSPYLDLNPNYSRTYVSSDRILKLLKQIVPYTYGIRTYNMGQGVDQVVRLAKSLGLKVAAACWDLMNELNYLISECKNGNVDLAIVGTRMLSSGTSENSIITAMQQVRATGVPVTTSDNWYEYLTHPKIVEAVDVLFVTFNPFAEGISINEAVHYIDVRYKRLKEIAKGKEVIVGETGWLSSGNQIGNAVASMDNANFFLVNFVSWAKANNVKYYFFEAFDESWKTGYPDQYGACWGLFDGNGVMKTGVDLVFSGLTTPNNWSYPDKPAQLTITKVPARGTWDQLQGRVDNVVTADYGVALYHYGEYGGKYGWCNETLNGQGIIFGLSMNGTFSLNPKYYDSAAKSPNYMDPTKYKVYIVPKTYRPAALYYTLYVPIDVDLNAVAWQEIVR